MGETQQLAEFVVRTQYQHLPEYAVQGAKRCLLDWLGCALGASYDPAVSILIDTIDALGGNPQATVLGRGYRSNVPNVALVNGFMSHLLDFDDTMIDTVLHPTSPVMPAAVALAEQHRKSGRELITAFVLGFDVEARVAKAISPSHYEAGWHITGTVGALGAAVAAGVLLGLEQQKMAWAIALAASQPTGLREQFGTMGKAFHPGKAAMNGALAALLAQRGFTGAETALEGPNGFLRAMSREPSMEALTKDLGQRYLIEENSFKPYPCGVVNHPLIDGALKLRREFGIEPEQVESIQARMSDKDPIPQLAANPHPATGLSAKFSLAHCAAVALVDGIVGVGQFTDEKVREPMVAELRDRFHVETSPTIREDEAYVSAVMKNGDRLEVHIPHATGTPENPMSDAVLEEKFRGLACAALSSERIDGIIKAVRSLEQLEDIGQLIELCVSSSS